ncbi:MAG: AAA family ATPase [Syntrophorhabdaceae bacterium]
MNTQTVIIKVHDKSALREIESAISSTGGYTIHAENGIPRDYLIYEITDDESAAQFEYLRNVVTTGVARNLVLVSGSTDPDILIRALKVGAREFFPLPLNLEDLHDALTRFKSSPLRTQFHESFTAPAEGSIIHIIGSKGGVGTTTLAVNLARNLIEAERGKKVALVDMNLLFGDIPIFLNMESPLFDWAEIARNISRLDSNFLMGTLYKHPSGLHVLPSPTGILESLDSGTEITAKLLGVMKTMFDYIVIDGGQNIGEMSKAIMKIADNVVIVTLLNLPCLVNIKRLKDAFLRLGYPTDDKLSIVANRVNKKSGNISIEDAERTTRKKINWTIPNDFINTMNAINVGQTLTDLVPGSEINKSIAQMAGFFHKQCVHDESGSRKAGLFGSFRNAMTRPH